MNSRARGQNLTDGIAHDLGVAIVTGVYTETNPFPVEAELCRQYGASRTVLREAVKMLTAKGLLGARPRRGTWVQPEDRWNLLDPDVLGWLLERKSSPALLIEFTEIRLAVEPGAAALAARAAGAAEKNAVRAAIERVQAAEIGATTPWAGFNVYLAASMMREAGMCHINGATVHDEAQMPFGGTKSSGYGRFGGKAGIAEFTELRWITIATQPARYPI